MEGHHVLTGQKCKRNGKNGMIMENKVSFSQEEKVQIHYTAGGA